MRRSVAEKPATSGLAGSSSILGGLRPPRSMAEGTHKVGFLIALGLGVAISAAGQGRGFSAPTRGSAAPVRGFSAPMRGFSGQVRGMSRPGRTSGFRRGFFFPPVVATPLNPNFEPINGVPGLGFDFPHLAAVSRGFQTMAFSHFLRPSSLIHCLCPIRPRFLITTPRANGSRYSF